MFYPDILEEEKVDETNMAKSRGEKRNNKNMFQ